MELPQALKEALEQEVPAGGTALAHSAQALSQRYRERTPQGTSFLAGSCDAAAYATSRLPATYAAVRAALVQSAARLPGFAPASLLDAGCGPGTALWAVALQWPSLERMTALERDAGMRALAARLAAYGTPALQRATFVATDLSGPWEAPASDLVTACYVLNELEPAQADALTRKLWEHTTGVLLIVEPGTKGGFATVFRARDILREQGEALIAAPCPHGDACPLADDWCHFSQRVARSRAHRQAKGGELGYEDEKYSYVCATRLPVCPAARVLRHPQVHKGHIVLSLCTAEGIKEATLSRKDGAAYQNAKDLKWGDAFEVLSQE